jgi:hypothetical protein
LSLRIVEIVREVADGLASNRDGFFLYKYASNMPNDQAIVHRRIRVIRTTGTCSDRRSRADDAGLRLALTPISGPND